MNESESRSTFQNFSRSDPTMFPYFCTRILTFTPVRLQSFSKIAVQYLGIFFICVQYVFRVQEMLTSLCSGLINMSLNSTKFQKMESRDLQDLPNQILEKFSKISGTHEMMRVFDLIIQSSPYLLGLF